jgi:hypothetical protein
LHGPPPDISRPGCRFEYSNLILNISCFKDNFWKWQDSFHRAPS